MSVEVCTIKGLVTQYILFFIDIASRSVHVAGITPHPDNSWMTQIARNITDAEDGFLRGTQYLILDRDAKYSDGFRSVLVREGVHVVRLPPRSPNLNAFAERFVRSIKDECLEATSKDWSGGRNVIGYVLKFGLLIQRVRIPPGQSVDPQAGSEPCSGTGNCPVDA